MKFIPLVFRNLLRNRRRTILTTLSLAISLFVFAALMSLPGVVEQILRDRAQSLRLICQSKAGLFYVLPEAYRRQIQALPHVEAVLGESLFMGTYRSPDDQIPSAAVDPERVDQMWPDFGIARGAAAEFERLRTASLVGDVLMRRYRWRTGDRITLRGTIYPVQVELTIVGTLSGSGPARYALLFRRDYLQDLSGGSGTANLFWVKVDGSRSIPAVIAAIDRRFANSPAETRTESELAASQAQMGGLRILFDGAKVLAALVMVAIGLVAANTAALSVRERRHEIGVMRAIGFRREVLILCLLLEGAIIGTVGGLAGCGLAYVVLRLIPRFSAELGPLVMILSLPPRVFVESMLLATALGALSSLGPALAATRREISTVLRAA